MNERSGPSSAVRAAAVCAYAALIFFLSSRHSLPAAAALLPDKVEHALLYGGFGAVWAWALTKPQASNKITRGLTAFLAAAAYGASDEWHQSFVAGRTADVADWLWGV